MILYLDDDSHERLWRICDALVSASGARAAMVCDAGSGSVLVSVGDTSASGAVSSVEALGPGERLVHGAAGQIYGVDVPGGALLAVLHDAAALDQVRSAAAQAVRDAAELIANLPPPPPPPAWPPVPHDAHGHVIGSPKPPRARKQKKAKARPAQKKTPAARKSAVKTKAAPKKSAPKKSGAKKKPAPMTKRAPAKRARSKARTKAPRRGR